MTARSWPVMCPLCGSDGSELILEKSPGGEAYHECNVCRLIFLDPRFHLSPDDELKRYATHNNDLEDPGYRNFLRPLKDAIAARMRPGACGLDYGCGPGPLLQRMFEEAGFVVSIYDPFFAADARVLDRTYDFITCSEVAEHFYRPGEEFARLRDLLNANGWLGIMTQIAPPRSSFASWYYHRDPTHVAFYSEETHRWIQTAIGFRELVRIAPAITLFRK